MFFRESKKRLASIFEFSSIGMAIVGLDGKFIQTNKALQEITGYSKKELESMTFQHITHPDDLYLDLSKVKQLYDGELDRYVMEKRYFHKDKSIIWILLTVSGVYGKNKKPRHYIAQVQDITKQKYLEEKTKKAKADLEDFAQIVSHDLKAPLRQISQIVEWIKEEKNEGLDRNIDLLQQRTQKLQSLIDSILTYTRATKSSDTTEEFETSEVVDEIFANFKITDPEFEFSRNSNLPKIVFNKTKFTQIIQNLVSNAVKHHNRIDGKIQVNFYENKNIVFSVEDDGPGVSSKYHKKIIQVFGNIGKSENSSGIGLAIVCKLVTDHDGDYFIESEEGSGFKFYFSFPKTIKR